MNKNFKKEALSICLTLTLLINSSISANANTFEINDKKPFKLDYNLKLGEEVNITDQALKDLLLKNVEEEKLTKENLARVTNLDASNQNITNIEGLQYCTSLKELQLSRNEISDISPLSELESLEELYLDNNEISDISQISELKSLRVLELSRNKISDISPLLKLESLEELYLENNKISDISSLSELESLNLLYLAKNEISDISSLEPLGIPYLDLSYQIVTLDKVQLETSEYTTKTPINLFGNKKPDKNEIFSMLPLGSYDEEGNVVWTDLDKEGTLKYSFKHDLGLGDLNFNGVVEQEYEIKGRSNTDPEIIGAKHKTIYIGDKYDPKEEVTAKDNEDGDLTNKIIISGIVDTSKAGNYDITYTVIDSDKNESTVKIKVTVKSKTSGGGGGSTINPNQKTVILASGEKYTDVLTATVLGNEKDAPILLSQKDKVDEKTLAEIKRLNVKKIIISGGKESVSDKVVNQLKDYNVTRIAGQDRFETAEKIGNEVRKTGNKDGAMLVDGTNFPDVITVSSLASQKRVPILLTQPQTLTNTTKDTINTWGINNVTIGGSYNSVSKDIENNLGIINVARFGGVDRYKTAELIGNEVRKISGNNDDMLLVDGTNFPDGITINSLAAKFKAPIMLTTPDTLTKVTADKITEWSIKNVLIGGGYNSVSKSIVDNLKVSKKERAAGSDRYETAVKISQRFSKETPIGVN
nr:cell wall-binding repeat-containing protein [Clostridioides sp.]